MRARAETPQGVTRGRVPLLPFLPPPQMEDGINASVSAEEMEVDLVESELRAFLRSDAKVGRIVCFKTLVRGRCQRLTTHAAQHPRT